MKGPASLYIKLFLEMGIPFGLIMGAIIGIKSGFLNGAYSAVVLGAFFGFFMALILGVSHQSAVKKIGADYGADLLKLHQTRSLTIDKPVAEVFDVCLKSLQSLKGCRIKSENKAAGTITGKMGSGLAAFGDSLEVTVSPNDGGSSTVVISSKPSLQTTVVDYGSNAKNVQRFVEELSKAVTLS